MQIMSSKLHQLTMSYSPKHDRILLRIGTLENTEYRLWLTRRFVRSVWEPLKKTLEGNLSKGKELQPKIKEAIMAMEHQELVQSSDFTKKHSTDNVNVTPMANISTQEKKEEGSKNLYKPSRNVEREELLDTGGVLVVGGRVRSLKNNLTQVNFKLDNDTGVEFTLNKKLLHALCHMLIQSSNKAGWRLDLVVGSTQVLSAENKDYFH